MCARPLGAGHPHVVDVTRRGLLCVCQSCGSLFMSRSSGAAGRYRGVPNRYLRLNDFRLPDAEWRALGIAVGVGFVSHSSAVGATMVFYPGPAGATESLQSQELWDRVLAAHPHAVDVADDTEALLIRRGHDDDECYVVPIDACYHFVGLVGTHWVIPDGGEVAWAAIEGFFATVADRSRHIPD